MPSRSELLLAQIKNEIDFLKKQNATQAAALHQARKQFREYADHHRDKGAKDKEERNRKMAGICDKALAEASESDILARYGEALAHVSLLAQNTSGSSHELLESCGKIARKALYGVE